MENVSGKSPKIAGSPPKESSVSTLTNVQDKLWEAFPPRRHDNRKSYFAFVAEQLGWKPRRVRAYFHGEVRRIDHIEIETLNQRIECAKAAELRHQEHTNAIRKSMDMGGSRIALDGNASPRLGDDVAGDRGVVPRSGE